MCFIAFSAERRGVTLVDASNLTGSSGAWRVLDSDVRTVQSRIAPRRVSEYIIARGQQRRLVWLWYSIGSRRTANPYQLRLFQTEDRLLGKPREVTLTAISAPIPAEISDAIRTLSEFR